MKKRAASVAVMPDGKSLLKNRQIAALRADQQKASNERPQYDFAVYLFTHREGYSSSQ